MFAIAIWDRPKQQLLLARDRAGKKPLYYAIVEGRMVFSSEMASLLEHPGISRELDPVAQDNYFCLGYVPAPHTIFKQVKQLEPGHFLKWKAGSLRLADTGGSLRGLLPDALKRTRPRNCLSS